MSAFPILFELDELSEVKALHAAINAALSAAQERFDEAEDACARVDEDMDDATQAEKDYRLADEELQVAKRLARYARAQILELADAERVLS